MQLVTKPSRHPIPLPCPHLVSPDPRAAVFDAKSVFASADVDDCDHWNDADDADVTPSTLETSPPAASDVIGGDLGC